MTDKKDQIAKAILAVMNDVKGVDKSMTVGTGQSSYKGVPDQEVKKIIGSSMAKNGLCIVPIEVKTNTRIDRWEESYNGNAKQKQSVFTEAETKYLLLHESGQSIELSGYGHGVDSQDKGAGKATTYALKYTLLYTFLVPTGKIDDADNHHSDESPTPMPKKLAAFTQATFDKMKKSIESGNADAVKSNLHLYDISEDFKQQLNDLLK